MVGVAYWTPAGWRGFYAVLFGAFLAHLTLVALTFVPSGFGSLQHARSPVPAPAVVEPVVREVLPAPARSGRIVGPASVADLEQTFDELGYHLDDVRGGAARVPRLRVAALPNDLGRVADIKRRKAIFLRAALPMILMAAEEVRQDRDRIVALRAARARAISLEASDQRWLAAMGARYGVATHDLTALLRAVDTVPTSLALAQSIEESGWGTSRFAREGKALYGQRTWAAQISGLVPNDRAAGKRFRVRSFNGLLDSARAYFFNLNTHPAYAELRAERARLRAKGTPLDGAHLAAFLARYAEIGDAYIDHIRRLIRGNRLAALDTARLTPPIRRQIAARVTDR